MNEMVERCARALVVNDWKITLGLVLELGGDRSSLPAIPTDLAASWPELDERQRDRYRNTVRIVIEQMREPTKMMLVAARDWSIDRYGKGIGNDAAVGCWQAMLNALS